MKLMAPPATLSSSLDTKAIPAGAEMVEKAESPSSCEPDR